MSPGLRVRSATWQDADELARLNALFNGVYDPAEAIARRMRDPRRVEVPLLAELDGRVVGFASLAVIHSPFYAQPHAEVTELFVEEPFRRQGVARALMAHAEDLARQAGAQEVYLVTDSDNSAALAFYRSLGYRRQGIRLAKELGPRSECGE